MSGAVARTVTVDDTDPGLLWTSYTDHAANSWAAFSADTNGIITVNTCGLPNACNPVGSAYQKLDPKQVANETWHELAGDASVFYNFTGIGVDVYFILLNGVGQTTNATLTIDGNEVGFTWQGSGTLPDFIYNYRAFGRSDLDNGLHTLEIRGDLDSLVAVDYLTYTELVAASSSTVGSPNSIAEPSRHSVSKAALGGGIAGGLVVLILSTALIVRLIIRRRNASREKTDLLENESAHPSPTPWREDPAPRASAVLSESTDLPSHPSSGVPEKATYRPSDADMSPPQYSEVPESSTDVD